MDIYRHKVEPAYISSPPICPHYSLKHYCNVQVQCGPITHGTICGYWLPKVRLPAYHITNFGYCTIIDSERDTYGLKGSMCCVIKLALLPSVRQISKQDRYRTEPLTHIYHL